MSYYLHIKLCILHCRHVLTLNKFWILRKVSPASIVLNQYIYTMPLLEKWSRFDRWTTEFDFGFGIRTTLLNFGLGSRTTTFIFGLGSPITVLNFGFGCRTTVCQCMICFEFAVYIQITHFSICSKEDCLTLCYIPQGGDIYSPYHILGNFGRST